jgi:hypothetical protein
MVLPFSVFFYATCAKEPFLHGKSLWLRLKKTNQNLKNWRTFLWERRKKSGVLALNKV